MEVIRLMLVDDHQVVREGLRRMLELEPDMRVVAEAANAEEAMAQASKVTPDIILMDIKMPGVDGIELTRRLKEQNPQFNILVLTLYDEYFPRAIEVGAAGYLRKDLRREELIEAIRMVVAGKSPLNLTVERGRLAGLLSGSSGRLLLSERELAVLRLAANGAVNKEIAAQLSLSQTSVNRAFRQAFSKLGVRNRSEAIAEGYRRHLLTS